MLKRKKLRGGIEITCLCTIKSAKLMLQIKKQERGRGLGSARNQREPDKGEDRLRIDAAGRRRQAACPRRRGSKMLSARKPYPLDRHGAPAGLHGNWEEASARPRAAAARPTRPCMVAARIRWLHPRIHRLRQQLGVVPAPSGTRALPPRRARIFVGQGRRRWSRGRGRRRWLGPAMKTKGGEGSAHLRWGGQGEEKKGRWGGGGSEVRLERGGEQGEVGFGGGEGDIYLMIDAP